MALLPRPKGGSATGADPTDPGMAGTERHESCARLGRHRWVVDRTPAWFSQFRGLAGRYERGADIHLALTTLASALITRRLVGRSCCREHKVIQPERKVVVLPERIELSGRSAKPLNSRGLRIDRRAVVTRFCASVKIYGRSNLLPLDQLWERP